MKLCFRWYGESDPVTLDKIRQIPTVKSIVSAVYDTKPGNVWSYDSINKIKNQAQAHGLSFEVVESVPVPEDIKLGNKNASELTANYAENIRRLGAAGVKCICYNFMPVYDWLRSELEHIQPDGANALAYDESKMLLMDPINGELSLPGWDTSYSKQELQSLTEQYKRIGEQGLWENLSKFLHTVIPAAQEAGVNMAIHPDDPPWGIFGLPRIITCKQNIKRMLDIVPQKNNGITLCTGSLGADPNNCLIDIAGEFADRIHFLHMRNIKITGYRKFEEVAHPTDCGDIDMFGIAKALYKHGFDGYVRPDHGRMIWGEVGRYGYGLYDRALGATYIAGIFEAIEKENRK